MDGQHSTHGPSYAYSLPSFPEFYDLWVSSIFGPGPSEDVSIFTSALKPFLSRPKNQDITIVDLGTGTGRVVRDLMTSLNLHHGERGESSEGRKVKIFGIDHSASMLARAQKLQAEAFPSLSGNDDGAGVEVQWQQASASNFLSVIPALQENVSILIFAAGGIGHLTLLEERVAFLAQVREALRNDGGGGGIAIISVLEEVMSTSIPDSIPTDELEVQASSDTLLQPELPGSTTLPSLDNPGLIYLKTPTTAISTSTPNGRIRTDRFTVRAMRGQEVEWEEEMVWSVKEFQEDVWRKQVEGAGLRIRKVEKGEIQRWFFLEIDD